MLDVRLAGRLSDGDIDEVVPTIVYYLEVWSSVVSPVAEMSRLLDDLARVQYCLLAVVVFSIAG